MSAPDWAGVDVAVPRPSARLPGVSMAGFRRSAPAPRTDIAMVVHPSVTLLIDLGDRDRLTYDTRGRRERGSVVIGLLPGELRARCQGVECLQIRLAPAVAAAVLGSPAELTGEVVRLSDVWGRDADRAEERLHAAGSWDARFSIVTSLLAARATGGRPVDAEVAHVWRRTVAARGRVRVDALAGEVGWSRKRLWSRFRSQLGLNPKHAARLVRFDHAAHLLVAGHPAAGVAAASGYADQSHLHREVKEFAGLAPAAVAVAPWLTIDDVAWPATRVPRRDAGR